MMAGVGYQQLQRITVPWYLGSLSRGHNEFIWLDDYQTLKDLNVLLKLWALPWQ